MTQVTLAAGFFDAFRPLLIHIHHMDNLKKVGYWVGLLFILLVVRVIAREFVNQTYPAPKNTSVIEKDAFIKSCLAKGSTQPYCDCSYDQMNIKFTLTGLKQMNEEYAKTGILPEEALEIIRFCKNQAENGG